LSEIASSIKGQSIYKNQQEYVISDYIFCLQRWQWRSAAMVIWRKLEGGGSCGGRFDGGKRKVYRNL